MLTNDLRIVVLSALALFFAGAFTAMLLGFLRTHRQWTVWVVAGGLLSTCLGMWFVYPQAAGFMLLLICAWGLPVLIACQIINDKETAARISKYEGGLDILREEHRA